MYVVLGERHFQLSSDVDQNYKLFKNKNREFWNGRRF